MASPRDTLLAELLELDPELQKHEDELKELLSSLEESRLTATPRAQFRQELLLTLRTQMSAKETAPLSIPFSFSLMVQRILFTVGGAAVGALAVLLISDTTTTVPTTAPSEEQQEMAADPADEPSQIALEPKAFGTLSFNGEGGVGAARPQSGGGGGVPATESMIANPADSRMMIAPEPYTQVRYQYDGNIVLPEGDVAVYRRLPPTSAPSATSASRGFADSMLNWNMFRNLQLRSVYMQEAGTSGYSINIDYNEGNLSINRNVDPDSRPQDRCQDEACYNRYRLGESDMLSDQRIIEIAQAFANRFGVDLAEYGTPVVQNDWRRWYNQSEDKASYYFPEQLSVVFPKLIDGKPVYEEYGAPYGVTMYIDVRNEEVMSLYNYYFPEYEYSDYAPLSDVKQAQSLLEYGSIHMWDDPNADTVFATLGEPEEAYMHYNRWDADNQRSRSLMVPALVFPVTEPADTPYDNREQVIIPLIADFYDDMNFDRPMPRPLPMPVEPLEAPATEPAILE